MESLSTNTNLSVLQVNLVAEHHEGEVFRISRAGLDQELIPPAVECLEGVGCSHIEHQHTAVGSTIERNTQRLEPLLTSRVPDLDHHGQQKQKQLRGLRLSTGNNAID